MYKHVCVCNCIFYFIVLQHIESEKVKNMDNKKLEVKVNIGYMY